MGIEQLTRLLLDAAEDVPAPQFAEQAWARAARVRRRRRVVGSSVTAAVLAGTAWLVAAAPFASPGPDDATPNATVTLPATPITQVDRMPASLVTVAVPPFPRALDEAVSPDVVRLSAHPVARAVALYEQPVSGPGPSPVYVLGDDGALRRLDSVALNFVSDATKDTSALPLTTTALSPDGRLAAFPQLDEVVVVDLTIAKERRFAVPGFNLQVRWQSPGTFLVGQAGAAYSVDVASGRVTRAAGGWSFSDAAPDPAGTSSIVELAPGATSVREWALDATAPRRVADLDQRELAPHPIGAWSGPAWRFGDVVARAGYAAGLAPVVAVVDVRTGVLARVLVFEPGRGRNCCITLGWLDAHTVLVQVDDDGVIAWDISTGRVQMLIGPFKGVLAVLLR